MKYIPADKLIAEIDKILAKAENDEKKSFCKIDANGHLIAVTKTAICVRVKKIITSLQQEQPEGNLEYWLEHFGMPKENIDNCITQIAQGYGACRYLEGIQHGAEAVNELARQEQPEVNLEKEAVKFVQSKEFIESKESPVLLTARHFYELGLKAIKK